MAAALTVFCPRMTNQPMLLLPRTAGQTEGRAYHALALAALPVRRLVWYMAWRIIVMFVPAGVAQRRRAAKAHLLSDASIIAIRTGFHS